MLLPHRYSLLCRGRAARSGECPLRAQRIRHIFYQKADHKLYEGDGYPRCFVPFPSGACVSICVDAKTELIEQKWRLSYLYHSDGRQTIRHYTESLALASPIPSESTTLLHAGNIAFGQFIAIVDKINGDTSAQEQDELLEAFRMFGGHVSGHVSAQQFQDGMFKLGVSPDTF